MIVPVLLPATLQLLIMIFGFALAGMNIFGQETDQFINEINSFTTLFLTILGESDCYLTVTLLLLDC